MDKEIEKYLESTDDYSHLDDAGHKVYYGSSVIRIVKYHTKHLTEQLALKDSDYSDLQNRNIELIEQLAEKYSDIERWKKLYYSEVNINAESLKQLAEKEKELSEVKQAYQLSCEVLEKFKNQINQK